MHTMQCNEGACPAVAYRVSHSAGVGDLQPSVKSGEFRDAVCALPVPYTAVKHLQSLGASVVEVSLPEMEEARVAHVICILSEMRDFLQPDFNKHFHEMVSSISLEQCQ